jgi:hypothetical protein
MTPPDRQPEAAWSGAQSAANDLFPRTSGPRYPGFRRGRAGATDPVGFRASRAVLRDRRRLGVWPAHIQPIANFAADARARRTWQPRDTCGCRRQAPQEAPSPRMPGPPHPGYGRRRAGARRTWQPRDTRGCRRQAPREAPSPRMPGPPHPGYGRGRAGARRSWGRAKRAGPRTMPATASATNYALTRLRYRTLAASSWGLCEVEGRGQWRLFSPWLCA